MTGLHRLLVNQAGTFLGDALLIAAFPLLAVHVTRSPALISAVGASATLPWVVVGLPSGLAADRWERRRLMASASLLGCLLLLALAAIVGGVVGAPLAPRLARTLGRGRLLTICIPVFAAGLAVPALWPNAFATGAAFAGIGAVSCLYNVSTVAFRQRVIPASHLGRVTASYRLLSFGALPLGAVLGGLIASQLGVRAVFPIAAAIAMLTALGLPFVRERSLRAAETQAGQATV
jgi:MFS family permease